MSENVDIDYIKERVLCKFPLLGVNLEKLNVVASDDIMTAATDGNTVYYSPKFFSGLNENQQTFTFTHEVMHVTFNHIMRCKNRDLQLWNVATDAVINQILQHEGLDIPQGYINIPQALNKSADEMYDLLLKEKENSKEHKLAQYENKKQDQQQEQQDQQQGGNSQQGEQSQQQGGNSQQGEQSQQQGGNSQQGLQDQQQGGNSQQGEQSQQQGGNSQQGEQDQQQGGSSQQGQQQSGNSQQGLQDQQQGGNSQQGEQDQQQGGSSQQGQQQSGNSQQGLQDQQQGGNSQQGEQSQQQGGNSQQGEQSQQQGGSSQQGLQNQQSEQSEQSRQSGQSGQSGQENSLGQSTSGNLSAEEKNTGESVENEQSQTRQNSDNQQYSSNNQTKEHSPNQQAGGQSSQSLSGQSKNQFTGESQAPQNDNNSILTENNLRDAGNANAGGGNHDIWKEVIKEHEDKEKKKTLIEHVKKIFHREGNKSQQQNNVGAKSYSLDSDSYGGKQQDGSDENYERNFLKDNEQKRHDFAQKSRISIEKNKYRTLKKAMADKNIAERFGEVGESEHKVADWRKILKKSIEEEDSRWSYRRSSAANDYMARVEDIEEESKSKTQVMIDVSGSVSGGLVREFLRQIKPILKDSDLEVGFFDDVVYEFKKIKKAKDIDNLNISGGGGTNIDNAIRAFSRKKEINKIVFTDGYGYMPRADLAKMNVLWVVYDNDNFDPICGQVIYVNRHDIMKNYKDHTENRNYYDADDDYGLSMQYALKNRRSR